MWLKKSKFAQRSAESAVQTLFSTLAMYIQPKVRKRKCNGMGSSRGKVMAKCLILGHLRLRVLKPKNIKK